MIHREKIETFKADFAEIVLTSLEAYDKIRVIKKSSQGALQISGDLQKAIRSRFGYGL